MTRHDFILRINECVNGLAMGTDPIIDNRVYVSLFIQEKKERMRKNERKKERGKKERKKCRDRKTSRTEFGQ